MLCLALLTLLGVDDASAAGYTPRADAEVLKDRPNSSFGKKQAMRIDGSPVSESLVVFDVTSLSGPVVKATLRIYPTRGTNGTARLYRTSTSWTETKVTWNTRPARTTGVVASRDGFPANVWIELDVTSQVRGAGTYSFGLATSASDGATFATREAARKPELVVAVAGGTEADAKPPTAPAELSAGAASQTSIALSWPGSSDDVGVTGYGIYLDGAKVLDVSGTSATVGSLACGTSYSFTVDARDAAGNRSGQSAPLAAATAACDPSPPPPARILWGTAAGGGQYGFGNAPWDMRALDRFEQNAGKRVSILHFGQSFRNSDGSDSDFPAGTMQLLRERGIIPLLNYAPQQSGRGVEQPDFQLADIIEGRHDAYLRRYAAAVAAWGHPFFLRFAHEMNGAWYPWSELRNGNETGEFVRAWRHVHDIFRAQGAGNATWVWCPNVEYWGTIKPLSSLYPGDAYVDWTCLDGYNWGTDPAKPDAWRSFEQLFRASYDLVAETIAPDKPLMIGETGSTEIGGSKATWLRNALLTEIPRFPKLKAFLYFNLHDDGVDWQIESSTSAQTAFAQGIASDTYAAR